MDDSEDCTGCAALHIGSWEANDETPNFSSDSGTRRCGCGGRECRCGTGARYTKARGPFLLIIAGKEFRNEDHAHSFLP